MAKKGDKEIKVVLNADLNIKKVLAALPALSKAVESSTSGLSAELIKALNEGLGVIEQHSASILKKFRDDKQVGKASAIKAALPDFKNPADFLLNLKDMEPAIAQLKKLLSDAAYTDITPAVLNSAKQVASSKKKINDAANKEEVKATKAKVDEQLAAIKAAAAEAVANAPTLKVTLEIEAIKAKMDEAAIARDPKAYEALRKTYEQKKLQESQEIAKATKVESDRLLDIEKKAAVERQRVLDNINLEQRLAAQRRRKKQEDDDKEAARLALFKPGERLDEAFGMTVTPPSTLRRKELIGRVFTPEEKEELRKDAEERRKAMTEQQKIDDAQAAKDFAEEQALLEKRETLRINAALRRYSRTKTNQRIMRDTARKSTIADVYPIEELPTWDPEQPATKPMGATDNYIAHQQKYAITTAQSEAATLRLVTALEELKAAQQGVYSLDTETNKKKYLYDDPGVAPKVASDAWMTRSIQTAAPGVEGTMTDILHMTDRGKLSQKMATQLPMLQKLLNDPNLLLVGNNIAYDVYQMIQNGFQVQNKPLNLNTFSNIIRSEATAKPLDLQQLAERYAADEYKKGGAKAVVKDSGVSQTTNKGQKFLKPTTIDYGNWDAEAAVSIYAGMMKELRAELTTKYKNAGVNPADVDKVVDQVVKQLVDLGVRMSQTLVTNFYKESSKIGGANQADPRIKEKITRPAMMSFVNAPILAEQIKNNALPDAALAALTAQQRIAAARDLPAQAIKLAGGVIGTDSGLSPANLIKQLENQINIYMQAQKEGRQGNVTPTFLESFKHIQAQFSPGSLVGQIDRSSADPKKIIKQFQSLKLSASMVPNEMKLFEPTVEKISDKANAILKVIDELKSISVYMNAEKSTASRKGAASEYLQFTNRLENMKSTAMLINKLNTQFREMLLSGADYDSAAVQDVLAQIKKQTIPFDKQIAEAASITVPKTKNFPSLQQPYDNIIDRMFDMIRDARSINDVSLSTPKGWTGTRAALPAETYALKDIKALAAQVKGSAALTESGVATGAVSADMLSSLQKSILADNANMIISQLGKQTLDFKKMVTKLGKMETNISPAAQQNLIASMATVQQAAKYQQRMEKYLGGPVAQANPAITDDVRSKMETRAATMMHLAFRQFQDTLTTALSGAMKTPFAVDARKLLDNMPLVNAGFQREKGDMEQFQSKLYANAVYSLLGRKERTTHRVEDSDIFQQASQFTIEANNMQERLYAKDDIGQRVAFEDQRTTATFYKNDKATIGAKVTELEAMVRDITASLDELKAKAVEYATPPPDSEAAWNPKIVEANKAAIGRTQDLLADAKAEVMQVKTLLDHRVVMDSQLLAFKELDETGRTGIINPAAMENAVRNEKSIRDAIVRLTSQIKIAQEGLKSGVKYAIKKGVPADSAILADYQAKGISTLDSANERLSLLHKQYIEVLSAKQEATDAILGATPEGKEKIAVRDLKAKKEQILRQTRKASPGERAELTAQLDSIDKELSQYVDSIDVRLASIKELLKIHRAIATGTDADKVYEKSLIDTREELKRTRRGAPPGGGASDREKQRVTLQDIEAAKLAYTADYTRAVTTGGTAGELQSIEKAISDLELARVLEIKKYTAQQMEDPGLMQALQREANATAMAMIKKSMNNALASAPTASVESVRLNMELTALNKRTKMPLTTEQYRSAEKKGLEQERLGLLQDLGKAPVDSAEYNKLVKALNTLDTVFETMFGLYNKRISTARALITNLVAKGDMESPAYAAAIKQLEEAKKQAFYGKGNAPGTYQAKAAQEDKIASSVGLVNARLMQYVNMAATSDPSTADNKRSLQDIEAGLSHAIFDKLKLISKTPMTQRDTAWERSLWIEADAQAYMMIKNTLEKKLSSVYAGEKPEQTNNIQIAYEALRLRKPAPLGSGRPLDAKINDLQKQSQAEITKIMGEYSAGQFTEMYTAIKNALANPQSALGSLQAQINQAMGIKNTAANSQKMMMAGPIQAMKMSATTGLKDIMDQVMTTTPKGSAGYPALMRQAEAYRDTLTKIANINKEVFGEHATGAQEKTRGFFSSMIRAATALGAAWYMISRIQVAFQSLVMPGLTYARLIETTNVGFAAILMSMTKLNGQSLTWVQSMNMAADLSKEVTDNALRFGLDAIELQKLIQGVVGAGLGSNMSLEQIIRLSTVAASAIKQIGLPDTQFIQEVRDMMQGGIQIQSSVLATQLGLTDAIVNQARASGTVFEMLMERMSGFAAGQSAVFDTLDGKVNMTVDAFKRLSAEGVAPLINTAKPVLDFLLKEMITNFDAFRKGASPEFNTTFITKMQEAIRTFIKVCRDAINVLEVLYNAFKIVSKVSDWLPGSGTSQLAAVLIYWFGIRKIMVALPAAGKAIVAMYQEIKAAAYAASIAQTLAGGTATTGTTAVAGAAVAGAASRVILGSAGQVISTVAPAAAAGTGIAGARALVAGGGLGAGILAAFGGAAGIASVALPIILAVIATGAIAYYLSKSGYGSALPTEKAPSIANFTAMRKKYDSPLEGEDAGEIGSLYETYQREIVLIDDKRKELLETFRVGNIDKEKLTTELTALYEKEVAMDIERQKVVKEALEKQLLALGAPLVASPDLDISDIINRGEYVGNVTVGESDAVQAVRAKIEAVTAEIQALFNIGKLARDKAATLAGIEAKNATVKQPEIEAIRKAISEYHSNRIDMEVSIAKKSNELILQRLERLYSARGISSADYVAKKLAIELANIDLDIAAARQKQGLIINEMRLLLNNMVTTVRDAIKNANTDVTKQKVRATSMGDLVDLTQKNVGQYKVGWMPGRYNAQEDGVYGQVNSSILLDFQRVMNWLSINQPGQTTVTSTNRTGDPGAHGGGLAFDLQNASWYGKEVRAGSPEWVEAQKMIKAFTDMGLTVLNELNPEDARKQYKDPANAPAWGGAHLDVRVDNWAELLSMPKTGSAAQFNQDVYGAPTAEKEAVKQGLIAVAKAGLGGPMSAGNGMARIDAEVAAVMARLGIRPKEVSPTVANVTDKSTGINRLILDRLLALNSLGSNALGIQQISETLNTQGAFEKLGEQIFNAETQKTMAIEKAYYELIDKHIEDIMSTLTFLDKAEKASPTPIKASEYKAISAPSQADFERWANLQKTKPIEAYPEILAELVKKYELEAKSNPEARAVLRTILDFIKENRQQLTEGGPSALKGFTTVSQNAAATANVTSAITTAETSAAALEKGTNEVLRKSYGKSFAQLKAELDKVFANDEYAATIRVLENAMTNLLTVAGKTINDKEYIALQKTLEETKNKVNDLKISSLEMFVAMAKGDYSLAEANRKLKNWKGGPTGGNAVDNAQRQKDAQPQLQTWQAQWESQQTQLNQENASPNRDISKVIALTNAIATLKGQYADLNKEVSGFSISGAAWINTAGLHEVMATSMADSFMSIIDGSKSVVEAFKSMALNVVKYILQMMLQELAWKATSSILKGIGFGGGATASSGKGSFLQGNTSGGISGIFGQYAEGGLIKGPGTGTSDSILARVANGEFIVRAASVDTYGVDFFQRLNKGLILSNKLPRFADGGLVTSQSQTANLFQANGASSAPASTSNSPSIVMHIHTQNAESFRQSKGQITADMTRALMQGRRNM